MKLNLPTKLSLSRLVLALVLFVFYSIFLIGSINEKIKQFSYVNFSWVDLTACLIFGVAAITDAFDGRIARKRNQITDFGKFIDPIADKFLINGSFILLALKVDANGHFYLFPLITVLFICRDLMVDAIRLMLVKKNIVLAANAFGKMKTILQSITIPIIFLNGFPFNLISLIDNSYLDYMYILTNVIATITVIASLVSGFIYYIDSRHVFKEEEKEENNGLQ